MTPPQAWPGQSVAFWYSVLLAIRQHCRRFSIDRANTKLLPEDFQVVDLLGIFLTVIESQSETAK
jgi:hypothetical protein